MRRIEVSCGVFDVIDERPLSSVPATEANVGADEPVVLLHGFTGNKHSLAALSAVLRARRRVISFDLPWHGGTVLSVPESEFSIERCAGALIEALDKLGARRFALFGYSMGGRIALALALNFPYRVARLMLESASAGLKDKAARAARVAADRELAAFAEKRGIEAFVARWESMELFASFADLPESTRAELRRARWSCSAPALAACLRAMGLGAQACLEDRLDGLRAPTLLTAGSRDEKFCAIARALARAIAGARLEIIEGAGHAPHLERPAEFNRLAAGFLAP